MATKHGVTSSPWPFLAQRSLDAAVSCAPRDDSKAEFDRCCWRMWHEHGIGYTQIARALRVPLHVVRVAIERHERRLKNPSVG
jgi:hypothetical protein